MVMFLYRPEYYDINSSAEGENIKGLTEVKIAKHRNGSLDTIKLKALLHIQKFINWDEDAYSGIGLPPGGWRQIEEGGGEKLYIQTGSKMNDSKEEEEKDKEDNDMPFQ